MTWVTLDSTLSLEKHVNNTVKTCNFHLQALCHVRQSITRDVANGIWFAEKTSLDCYHWMSLQSYSRIQAHDTANDTKVSKPNTLIIIIKTIALSLALFWTTVTLCFTACHEKTLISFRTRPEPCSTDRLWRWSTAAKCTAATSQPTLAASSSKNQLQVGDIELQVMDDGSTWLSGCRTSFLSTTALSTFVFTGTV